MAKTITLKNPDGNILYPITKSSNIIMTNGDNLDTVISSNKIYLHKIELTLINSSSTTTASLWFDYWSEQASEYSNIQITTHTQLSQCIPCTGFIGTSSGKSQAYCLTLLPGAAVINKSTEIDINSNCKISDTIIGFMYK